jgi:hypothetical protein
VVRDKRAHYAHQQASVYGFLPAGEKKVEVLLPEVSIPFLNPTFPSPPSPLPQGKTGRVLKRKKEKKKASALQVQD